MPPKSASAYADEIKSLYPEVQLLKAYTEADPEDSSTLKELEKKKNTLRYYRDKWATNLDVIVYVANNEQLPNTPEELGYETQPMPTYHAKKWPWYQTGDYQAYIQGIGWYPVVRERKTLSDLDNTLRDKYHRKNFYEEFERFQVDSRFNIFRFDLECDPEQFYNSLPQWHKTCKFCEVKRLKMDSGDYYCPRSGHMFQSYSPGSDFKCREGFVERERAQADIQRIKTTRKTILRQCLGMGMQVVWRGSRVEAYKAYRPELEEWAKINYVKLLGLENKFYNDAEALRNRKAMLEVELEAINNSLKIVV
jgi:hypothetical protein